MSGGMQIPETSLRNVLEEVALDPYTIFLFLSWSGMAKSDFDANQLKILNLN